jgi:hypothetical protein
VTKIVERKGVPCKALEQGWRVKVWHSRRKGPAEGLKARYGRSEGTGQREIIVTRRVVYAALSEAPIQGAVCDGLGQDFGVDVDLAALEDKALKAKRRSQRRAKQTCRHKIKDAGLRSLLTGTYRENMQDYDRMRRDFAAWLRIMRREIPGFRAVYAFERQARGAWHFHCATDRLAHFYLRRGVKVKSYELARRAWRAVVGADNGNIDVDGHQKGRAKRHADQRKESLCKLAGYVSKYLTKDYDGHQLHGRNMWGSTQGLTAEPPTVLEIEDDCPLGDVIAACCVGLEGWRVATHVLLPQGAGWMLYLEPGD